MTDQDLVYLSITAGYEYNEDTSMKKYTATNGVYKIISTYTDEPQAVLVANEATGETAVIFAGSVEEADWRVNAENASGKMPDQYNMAPTVFSNLSNQAVSQGYSAPKYVAGNSLGGGLANCVAMQNPEIKSVTINPSIVPEPVLDMVPPSFNLNCTNYISENDPLNDLQSAADLSESRVPGNKIIIKSGVPGFNSIVNAHKGKGKDNNATAQLFIPFNLFTNDMTSSTDFRLTPESIDIFVSNLEYITNNMNDLVIGNIQQSIELVEIEKAKLLERKEDLNAKQIEVFNQVLMQGNMNTPYKVDEFCLSIKRLISELVSLHMGQSVNIEGINRNNGHIDVDIYLVIASIINAKLNTDWWGHKRVKTYIAGGSSSISEFNNLERGIEDFFNGIIDIINIDLPMVFAYYGQDDYSVNTISNELQEAFNYASNLSSHLCSSTETITNIKNNVIEVDENEFNLDKFKKIKLESSIVEFFYKWEVKSVENIYTQHFTVAFDQFLNDIRTRLSEPIDTLLKGIHRVGWVLSEDLQGGLDGEVAKGILGQENLQKLKLIGSKMMTISDKLKEDNLIELIISTIRENEDNILNAIFNEGTYREISYRMHEATNYSNVVYQQLDGALDTMLQSNYSATITAYAETIQELIRITENLYLDLNKLIKQQK